jgi:small GTP-binding protein
VVQSKVPLEIFEVFVKALETGRKIPITKENASTILILAREFWVEDLVCECSALEAVLDSDRITTLSERISTLENQISSQLLTIVPELKESIRNHDRQLEYLIPSIDGTTISLRREIEDVRHSVQLLHRDVEALKSDNERQLETLRRSIVAFDLKITDSLSPVTARLSICEQQIQSRSPVSTPSPTPLPVPASPPTPKPAQTSLLSQGKPSPTPLPPTPVSRTVDDSYGYHLKIIMVGDTAVGKSQIVSQFVEQEFKDKLTSTVGVSFSVKPIDVHNYKAKLQIWDTSGIECYRPRIPFYCRGVVGALAVYDITDSNSFRSIRDWLSMLRNIADPHVAILLVGNKTDREEKRTVSFEEGKRLAAREHLLFIETSAKDTTSVSRAFEMLAAQVIAGYEKRAFD